MNTKNSILCPMCDSPIVVADDAEEGEIVSCEDCGADLEVVATDPIVLELAPEEEEDWGE